MCLKNYNAIQYWEIGRFGERRDDLLSLNTEVRGEEETRRFYERFAICDLRFKIDFRIRIFSIVFDYLYICLGT